MLVDHSVEDQLNRSALPRVLMIATRVPLASGDGTPSFILDNALALANDFDITILAPRIQGSQPIEHHGTLTVRRFAYFPRRWERLADEAIMPQLGARPLLWVQAIALVASMVLHALILDRELRPRLVHAQWILPSGLAALALEALRGTPYIVTSRGADAFRLSKGPGRRVKQVIVNHASHLIGVSQDIVQQFTPTASRTSVQPTGIDFSMWSHVRATRDPEAGRALFVGRLAAKKGLADAIQAVSIVDGIELRIAGDGPLAEDLRALALNLGVERRVTFLGRLDRAHVADEFKRAALVIIPSVVAPDGDRDGTPNVLGEAIASGVPVLASDIAGLSEYVQHGKTGLLATPGDAKDIAERLREILEDPAAAEKRAAAAFEYFRSHVDQPEVARRYSDWYRRAIGPQAEPASTTPQSGVGHVAFIVDELGGGGAQRSALLIANTLHADGVPTSLLAALSGTFARDVHEGLPVHLLAPAWPKLRSVGTFARNLRKTLRHIQASIAVTNGFAITQISLALRSVGLLRSTAIVVVQHNTLSVDLEHRFRRTFTRSVVLALTAWLYRRADAIIGVSTGVAHDLETTLRLRPGSVTAVHNPVDVARIQKGLHQAVPSELEEAFSSLPRPIIITVGRLVEQKAHLDLLDAFAGLPKAMQGSLVILGDGPLRPELVEQSQRLQLSDRLWMPGFVANPWWFVARSDAFVLSSHWEGFGLVLVEALACGKPVISTDCPHGPREILSGINAAYLSPVGDAARLGHSIVEALSETRPRVAPDLSVYEPRVVVPQYVEVFRNIPARPTSRPRQWALFRAS